MDELEAKIRENFSQAFEKSLADETDEENIEDSEE